MVGIGLGIINTLLNLDWHMFMKSFTSWTPFTMPVVSVNCFILDILGNIIFCYITKLLFFALLVLANLSNPSEFSTNYKEILAGMASSFYRL